MMRAIGLPLMCLAMFSVAGGHWIVLQSVAWTQMLLHYSASSTVATAVEKTFDGKHPCSLCKQVAEGRNREEKTPATLKVDKKVEAFTATAATSLKKPDYKTFSYPRVAAFFLRGPDLDPPHPVPIS